MLDALIEKMTLDDDGEVDPEAAATLEAAKDGVVVFDELRLDGAREIVRLVGGQMMPTIARTTWSIVGRSPRKRRS
jgi:hypothetical protein